MELKSNYHAVDIPDDVSWPEFLFEKFAKYGNKEAIVSCFVITNGVQLQPLVDFH